MDSNEHGIMEQIEEHLEANILIYYTHETELYAESYDVMNRGTYCKILGTWRNSGEEESQPSLVPDRIGAPARARARRAARRS